MTDDWTTNEYVAMITAEELSAALTATGIDVIDCFGDEDGVSVAFPNVASAEAFMTLTVRHSDTPGSLYDHATGSCVTLRHLAEQYDGEVPDAKLTAAFAAGWTWVMHPHMNGRVMGWHTTVTIPTLDANQVTATLNAALNPSGIRHGGQL